MNFTEVVAKIEKKDPMPHKVPSLQPTQTALKQLTLAPPHPEKVILVAGTNGKGSTACMLSTLLAHAGKKVGLYTSPHLQCITERIQINNEPISKKDFVEVYQSVKKQTAKISHFEELTVMAAYAFWQKFYVDFAIFEVGMGGTWDATNALPHKINLITKISYDHEHLLGGTLLSIAKNKFGIVHPNSLVIHHPFEETEVQNLAQTVQKQTSSHWVTCPKAQLQITKGTYTQEPQYKVQSVYGDFTVSLPGPRGCENAMLALTAFNKLGEEAHQQTACLASVAWPGRMSRFHAIPQRRVYLSGDHNEQGIQSLLTLLSDYTYDKVHFLVSIGQKKMRMENMLLLLSEQKRATLTLTTACFMGRTDYGTWAQKHPYIACPKESLQMILEQSTAKDIIVITGSLYLVGEIMEVFAPKT